MPTDSNKELEEAERLHINDLKTVAQAKTLEAASSYALKRLTERGISL